MEVLISYAAKRVFEEWQSTGESFLLILNRLHSGRFSAKQRSVILKMVRNLRQSQKDQIDVWTRDFYETIYSACNYHIVGVD